MIFSFSLFQFCSTLRNGLTILELAKLHPPRSAPFETQTAAQKGPFELAYYSAWLGRASTKRSTRSSVRQQGAESLNCTGAGMPGPYPSGTGRFPIAKTHPSRTSPRAEGFKVACPEEIAFRYGYIDAEKLLETASTMKGNSYGRYLQQLLTERVF